MLYRLFCSHDQLGIMKLLAVDILFLVILTRGQCFTTNWSSNRGLGSTHSMAGKLSSNGPASGLHSTTNSISVQGDGAVNGSANGLVQGTTRFANRAAVNGLANGASTSLNGLPSSSVGVVNGLAKGAGRKGVTNGAGGLGFAHSMVGSLSPNGFWSGLYSSLNGLGANGAVNGFGSRAGGAVNGFANGSTKVSNGLGNGAVAGTKGMAKGVRGSAFAHSMVGKLPSNGLSSGLYSALNGLGGNGAVNGMTISAGGSVNG